MIQNEIGDTFFHGQTRQEVIDRIIDFELDNDIMPDWREVLEYGFTGYQNVEDEVLKELYLEYFADDEYEVDEEYESDPDHVPNDYVSVDGHGDHIPNDYPGSAR